MNETAAPTPRGVVAAPAKKAPVSIEWRDLNAEATASQQIVVTNRTADPILRFALRLMDIRVRSDESGEFIAVPWQSVSPDTRCLIYSSEDLWPEMPEFASFGVGTVADVCKGVPKGSVTGRGVWRVRLRATGGEVVLNERELYFQVVLVPPQNATPIMKPLREPTPWEPPKSQ